MAGLTGWDAFRDFANLQHEMNRIFDVRRSPEATLARYAPPVDVFEDAEGVTVTADLPGLDPKDVDVKVEDGTLSITGERKLEKEDRRDSYHRVERSYGTFVRSFSLPPTVDVEKIKAEHKNGVLRVFLPRREETKPRKVKVS